MLWPENLEHPQHRSYGGRRNTVYGLLHDQHDHLYFEYQNQWAVRRGNWKYYRDADGVEALYDLDKDRHEDHDVQAKYPEPFQALKHCVKMEHRDLIAFESPAQYDHGEILERQADCMSVDG